MNTAYPLHPAAELFPVMDEAAFAALVTDISEHGQREPILLLDGQVIDGRHRQLACQQLGIEPLVQVFDEREGDPIKLVVSLNLHRRHLTESQRAMVAAQLANMRQGERTDLSPSANLPKVSQVEAARQLGVGDRSVRHALEVRNAGASELVHAVESGQIAVSTAAQLSRLPVDEQRQVLTKTPQEIRAIAKEVQSRIQQAGVCGKSAVKIFDQVAADEQLTGADQVAVAEAINADEPPLPTPHEAQRIAEQNQTLVLGSDGRYHGPHVSAASAAAAEHWLALREGLESLCSIDADPQALIDCVPHYQHQNLSAWLSRALPLITRFEQVWKEVSHA